MNDRNFVEVTGKLAYPEYKETSNGYPRFTGKVIVTKQGTDRDGNDYSSKDFVRIVAWGDLARTMQELEENSRLNVTGRLSDRSYTGQCKACGADQKRFWYEVVVDNYTVV
jgi:single-stranded DNA-binding protein